MKHRLALLLSSFLLAIPALAQDKPKPIAAHPKVDQEKVDKAIQEGCKYLLFSGGGMGTFTHGQRNHDSELGKHNLYLDRERIDRGCPDMGFQSLD